MSEANCGLSPATVARAWRDQEFLESLGIETVVQLPSHPAGKIGIDHKYEKYFMGTLTNECNTLSNNCNTLSNSCNTLSNSCNTLDSSCNTLSSSCNTLSNSCNTLDNSCNTLNAGCNHTHTPPHCG